MRKILSEEDTLLMLSGKCSFGSLILPKGKKRKCARRGRS